MQQAYAAIGRAVVYAQMFETVLVPVFELFKMQTEPGYLEKTGGFVTAGAFKVPVKNIVKALSEKGNIAPDLEARLSAFVEDRHLLVHRWIQQNGWPSDDDTIAFTPIITLANRVERQAKELARMFAGYLIKYGNPDQPASEAAQFKERVAQLFHRAHIDV